MKNRKVLQIQNNFNIAVSDLAEQVAYAVKAAGGHITTSFLNQKGFIQNAESYADEVYGFGFSKAQLKGSRSKIVKSIKSFVHEYDFDTIIAHRFKPISIVLSINRALGLKQVIGVVHGFGDYDRKYRQWLIRWLIKDNCYFVAVSEPVRQYLLDLRCGFTEQNTVTINNAIDIDHVESMQLPRQQARQKLNIDQKRRVVGTIGRLVPVKDHRTLIAAIGLLKDQYPDVLLVIIGGGRLEPELRQLIVELGLEKHVLLTGAKAEAAQYVKAFDLFTLTSLSEGLPLALLEGMAGHLPVIGSDIPTVKWVVDRVGKTFAVGSADSLAEKLTAYLSMSGDELAAEGERLYRHVCEQHEVKQFRQQYLDLLQRVEI